MPLYLCSMKKQWYILASLLIVVLSLSACIRDNCGNTVCQNEGVCVQGNCACVQGYEGDNCEKLWTDKFDGVWTASDETEGLLHGYDLTIVSSLKDTFLVLGLVDSVDTVYCVRKSRYVFDMLTKTLPDTTQKITSGSGTINETHTSVTGLYSFAYGDSVVATKFTWAK